MEQKKGPFAAAVIVAAGSSSRMGQNKQWMSLLGQPVLLHTLQAFQQAQSIARLVVVTRPQDMERVEELCRRHGVDKLDRVVRGGATRQQSVAAGIAALPSGLQVVSIHDGARPLITPELIDLCSGACLTRGAVALGVGVKDTIKQADGQGKILATPDRAGLWAVQTPQTFLLERYRQALRQAEREGLDCTDDCQLMERAGHSVFLLPGSYENIKITTPEDIAVAEALFLQRRKTKEGGEKG